MLLAFIQSLHFNNASLHVLYSVHKYNVNQIVIHIRICKGTS